MAAWLALFAAIAVGLHAALFFFPEGWRWANDDRARTEWTLRAAVSLALALPASLWVMGRWFDAARRREEERRALDGPAPLADADAAAGDDGDDGDTGAGRTGCGGLLLALFAATLALRPATLLLFPRLGLDPARSGVAALFLWLVLCFLAIVLAQALVRAGSSRSPGPPPRGAASRRAARSRRTS